ncbi:MAG: TIGR01620 family protein, partial [Roseovarius sp.]|nr:TIGR01620 family protein [Roseovarius sp.]
MTKGPILIDLEQDEAEGPAPDTAPPVPDPEAPGAPQGRAMQTVATLAARRPSVLARVFWGLLAAVLTAALSVAAWDFAAGLLMRWPVLGYGVAALLAA